MAMRICLRTKSLYTPKNNGENVNYDESTKARDDTADNLVNLLKEVKPDSLRYALGDAIVAYTKATKHQHTWELFKDLNTS
jgi:hypothetical protein